jgi:hypothetical protein
MVCLHCKVHKRAEQTHCNLLQKLILFSSRSLLLSFFFF